MLPKRTGAGGSYGCHHPAAAATACAHAPEHAGATRKTGAPRAAGWPSHRGEGYLRAPSLADFFTDSISGSNIVDAASVLCCISLENSAW